MSDGKTDRSALMSIYRRTIAALNSLLSTKARDSWKNSNVGVNPLHRLRLEAMIAVSDSPNCIFVQVLMDSGSGVKSIGIT